MREQWGRSVIQFIKFNCVGVLNTLVDFAVYTLLCNLGLYYMLSQVISYSCGMVNSYVCNRLWTFREERGRTRGEFLKFALVNLASLGVSLGVLWLCRNVLGIQSDLWCKAVATPASVLVNFIGNKLFVFKSPGARDK